MKARIRRRSTLVGTLATLAWAEARAASPAYVVALGETELRTRGARFDGVSDDYPALQDAIDAALRQSKPSASVAVAMILPACRTLLSAPLDTGGCNFVLQGAGRDATIVSLRAGGIGVLVHGTHAQPAEGSLELGELTIEDRHGGETGAVGVSVVFGSNATQPTMTWREMSLRGWRAPSQIVNCPRNWHCGNVAVIGPDFTIQDGAAFEILSTSDRGCFSYFFVDVFVSNYRWGWRYDIRAPLEGQRFSACTCYNGWGMVQAVVSPDLQARHGIDMSYRSLLWAFDDCDWQGLGFALDMHSCRDILVRGGYFIANLNKGTLRLPGSQPRRRYLSFSACQDVVLDGVEIDVQPGMESTLALVCVDAGTTGFIARDTIIASFSNIYAAWEFYDAKPRTGPRDDMLEIDTFYKNWLGGEKRRDLASEH